MEAEIGASIDQMDRKLANSYKQNILKINKYVNAVDDEGNKVNLRAKNLQEKQDEVYLLILLR